MNSIEREKARETVICIVLDTKITTKNRVDRLMDLIDVMAGSRKIEDEHAPSRLEDDYVDRRRDKKHGNMERCDNCLGWVCCIPNCCWMSTKIFCLALFCMAALSAMFLVAYKVYRIFV